jgi:hypothetical protein
MSERQLSAEETQAIYETINKLNLKPYDGEMNRKSSELYYELEGKKYRLIYTPDLDWFCDIAYEGDY